MQKTQENQRHHQTWAEIDLSAIAHNVRQIRQLIRPDTRLLAVVKADAYGHGSVPVAQVALQHGVDALGVARLEEGITLRQGGIAAPILIFGYISPEFAPQLAEYNLAASVFSMDNALDLAAAAGRHVIAIHAKVDTGMGRLGLPCYDEGDGAIATAAAIQQMAALENLRLEGICTHFATADSADKTYARQQFARFQSLLDQLQLKTGGLRIPWCHAANSGAIFDLPETQLDMVRAGICLYGLHPSPEVIRQQIDLRPAMSLKSKIIQLKKVPAGTLISYGGTYQTSAPTAIATIPVGYADGYSRHLSNCGVMLVKGRRVPIVGRVCMDLTMIDVGGIDNAHINDEVVLIGRQGDEVITADEIAATLGTINYEIVTSLTGRVPRVYV